MNTNFSENQKETNEDSFRNLAIEYENLPHLGFIETLRIIARSWSFVRFFKWRFLIKWTLTLISLMFPVLVLPWTLQIMIDHVVLGIPIGGPSGGSSGGPREPSEKQPELGRNQTEVNHTWATDGATSQCGKTKLKAPGVTSQDFQALQYYIAGTVWANGAQKKNIECLVDTGAAVSLVKKNLVKKLY